MKSNKLLIYIIIILILSNLFFIFKYNNIYNKLNNNIDTVEIVKVDSFIKKDTLYYPKPYPKIIRVVDTMYIDKDSIQQEGDSILLPREEKTYTDDSTYNVRISGFQPILEDITVYPRTMYITKEKTLEIEKKQRFTWGIQGGFGYGLINRKPDFFIGVGCQYNF